MNGEQIESGSCRRVAELLQQAVAHRLIAILTTGRWTYHGIPHRLDATQRICARLRACFVLCLIGRQPANGARHEFTCCSRSVLRCNNYSMPLGQRDDDWRCPACYRRGVTRYFRAKLNRCPVCGDIPRNRRTRKMLRERHGQTFIMRHLKKYE